jgi:hypothetical protein
MKDSTVLERHRLRGADMRAGGEYRLGHAEFEVLVTHLGQNVEKTVE